MNKFIKKIIGALAGFAMVIGVGFGIANNKEAIPLHAVTPVTKSVTLSGGEFGDGQITWSLDGVISITQSKGTSGTNVNSSYISAPRVYKGHILSFEAANNYAIKSISITVNGTYYGNSMTAGTAIVENEVVDNSTAVSRTWTSTPGGTHVVGSVSDSGLPSVHIQNVATVTNVQLRISALSITYVSTSSSFLVTYDANGGTGTITDSNSPYESGDTVTVLDNEFTKDGFDFDHWNTAEDNTGISYDEGDTFEINDNITLYAQWAKNLGDLAGSTGTINFGSSNGSLNVNSTSVSGEDNLNVTWTVTTVAGAGGESFTQNASYSQIGASKNPASSITFESENLQRNYKITSFSAKFGGFNNTAGDIVLKVGDTQVGSGVLDGSNDVIISKTSTVIGSSLSVSVTNIDKGVKAYYISYTLAPEIESQIVSSDKESTYSDETITVSSTAETSVTWSIVSGSGTTATGASVTPSGVISVTGPGTVTVKAVANGYSDATKQVTFIERPAGNFYDVTFDSDGGSASPDPLEILEGGTFDFPSPGTKEHYSFRGWTSDLNNFYNVGDTSPEVTDDVEYIAWWDEDAKYTVTYSADSNGIGSFADENKYGGTYVLLPFNSLTGVNAEDGYRFADYTIGGVHKNPGDSFELSSNTVVTVNFEEIPKEYEVIFGTTDGTAGLSDFDNTSYIIPSGVTLDNMQGNLYGKNDNTSAAIRFGKSGTTGSFDVTIGSGLYIKTIVARLKYYSSDTTATFSVTAGDDDPISKSLTSSFADYEFDVSASYTNKVTLASDVEGKRVYLAGFTVFYDVKTAEGIIENDLDTLSALRFNYLEGINDTFSYTGVAIRFGAMIDKNLWSQLGEINGYGVIVAETDALGGQTLKQKYEAAEGADVAAKLTAMCNGTTIKKASATGNTPATATTEQKNYMGGDYSAKQCYIWQVKQSVGSGEFTKSFTSVAYIIVDGDIIFLQEVVCSAKSVATRVLPSINNEAPEHAPIEYMKDH